MLGHPIPRTRTRTKARIQDQILVIIGKGLKCLMLRKTLKYRLNINIDITFYTYTNFQVEIYIFTTFFDCLNSTTFWRFNTTIEHPGPAQDQGFGPLKHKILPLGLYRIYVMNIEINCDNHAKFQVKIYMLTIL